MSLASTFTKIKAQAYATYGKDPAKMLLHTGAFGWILSSIAQVAGVIVNDKIPTEQKKIPNTPRSCGCGNKCSFFLHNHQRCDNAG